MRKRPICNTTINKFFMPMRMICTHAAIKHSWGSIYNPFFGFKKLPERNPSKDTIPFSLKEQERVTDALPPHWRSYFELAFRSGLRPGEQIGLKPGDID